MMVPEEISMIVSSDPSTGAINRSSDGSYFEIQLQDGLNIPKEAHNINLSVEEASIWWTVPNIITGQNDKIYISGINTLDVLTDYVITIPQGLYDLSGLNQAILRGLENAGAKVNPNPLITLTADEPTQKVEIRYNYGSVLIDFTKTDTPRAILGFNSAIYGPYTAGTNLLAPNVAQFNQINYFLIHSDLTTKGIRFNNKYNQTISQVLIDVSPGSQIVSRPFNPARIPVPELGGARRTNFRMWLTDDEDRSVNTSGEYWTARIVIRYLRPFLIGNPDIRYKD